MAGTAEADGLGIEDLYERCSLDRFKRGFAAKQRNYVAFLDKNGIQHQFAPSAGAGRPGRAAAT